MPNPLPPLPAALFNNVATKSNGRAVWITRQNADYQVTVGVADMLATSWKQNGVIASLTNNSPVLAMQVRISKNMVLSQPNLFRARLRILGQATVEEMGSSVFLKGAKWDWFTTAVWLFQTRLANGNSLSLLRQEQIVRGLIDKPEFTPKHASFIMQELMITAGAVFAATANKYKLPFIYANQAGEETTRFSTVSLGHHSHGLRHYCRITAPLADKHDQGDRHNNRQMAAKLTGASLPYSWADLHEKCMAINLRAERHDAKQRVMKPEKLPADPS